MWNKYCLLLFNSLSLYLDISIIINYFWNITTLRVTMEKIRKSLRYMRSLQDLVESVTTELPNLPRKFELKHLNVAYTTHSLS